MNDLDFFLIYFDDGKKKNEKDLQEPNWWRKIK